MQIFGQDTSLRRLKHRFEVNIKINIWEAVLRYELDSSSLEWDLIVGFYDYGNESPGFVKAGHFFINQVTINLTIELL